MKDAECPRTLFEAIYVHWPQPPEVVVYDNSCHAMTYVLNREPTWFQDVQWVIDAAHFPGHTGCAYAFDIKRQPLLSKLNSQICEQKVSVVSMPVHSTFLHIQIKQWLTAADQGTVRGAEFHAGIGAEAVCFHESANLSSIHSIFCTWNKHNSQLALEVMHAYCTGRCLDSVSSHYDNEQSLPSSY